ncbi:MAG: hypothetical protein R3B38_00300 [Patescibacteria group bacterium]
MIEVGIKHNAGFEAIVMAVIMRSTKTIVRKGARFRRIAVEIGYDVNTHFSELIFFMEIYRFWIGQSSEFRFESVEVDLSTLRWIDGLVVPLMGYYKVGNDSVATTADLLPVLVGGLKDIFYLDEQIKSSFCICTPGVVKPSYGGYYYLDEIGLGFDAPMAGSDMVIGEATNFEVNNREYAFIKFATRISGETLSTLSDRVQVSGRDPYLCYDPELREVVEQRVVQVDYKSTRHFKVVVKDHSELDAFRKLYLAANEVFQKVRRLAEMFTDTRGEPYKLCEEFRRIDYTRQELSRFEHEKLDEISDQLKDIKVRLLEFLAEKDPELTPLVNLEETGVVEDGILDALKQCMNGGPRT